MRKVWSKRASFNHSLWSLVYDGLCAGRCRFISDHDTAPALLEPTVRGARKVTTLINAIQELNGMMGDYLEWSGGRDWWPYLEGQVVGEEHYKDDI